MRCSAAHTRPPPRPVPSPEHQCAESCGQVLHDGRGCPPRGRSWLYIEAVKHTNAEARTHQARAAWAYRFGPSCHCFERVFNDSANGAPAKVQWTGRVSPALFLGTPRRSILCKSSIARLPCSDAWAAFQIQWHTSPPSTPGTAPLAQGFFSAAADAPVLWGLVTAASRQVAAFGTGLLNSKFQSPMVRLKNASPLS